MTEREPSSDELEDYRPSAADRETTLHWNVLREPETAGALLLILAGTALLLGGSNITVRPYIIGGALIAISTAALIRVIRDQERRWGGAVAVIRPIVGILLGASLILLPERTGRAISLTLGAYVVVSGAADLLQWWKSKERTEFWQWPATKALLQMMLGIAILVIPGDLVLVALLLTGLAWVTSGLLAVVLSLVRGTPAGLATATMESLRWLQDREHTVAERRSLYDKLFFEGSSARRQLTRFFILMAFATTISTFGVIADSTAVVVGAMLIAPLMIPLMAASASIIMGWPVRASRSALVVLGGVALAVGWSFVVGGWIGFELDLDTNTQIVSRVSPTLIDMMIAVAAGGAGAFAMSRPDVSDALPGVAVSIALVPPLTVAGITLEAGAWSEAVGALLLFTTNAVAILLAGSAVFVLTGITPLRRVMERREWIRNTIGLVAILGAVVFAVLAMSSDEFKVQASRLGVAQGLVADWSPPDLNVFQVDLKDDVLSVVVVGPDEPPPASELAEALGEEFGRDVRVRVRWVPEQVFEAEFESSGG